MANYRLFGVLKQKFGIMLLVGLLFAAIGFFGLMFTEKRFQARMDFLVIQVAAGNQDFYSQFKSSEYLSKVLAESVSSERFINAVVATGKVNSEFLPADKRARLDEWKRAVTVKKNLELGVLSVTVKEDHDRDAARVMDGVSQVLTEQNSLFRGGDEKSVEVRVLSGPIIERNPTIARIVQVLVSAFFGGFFLTAFFVLVKSDAFAEQGGKKESSPGDGIQFAA